MNKLFLAFCLTIISSVGALAQATDYKKSEFYVGYTNNQVDTGANSDTGNGARDFFNDRLGFNGFEVAGVANVSRYVGIKGDISGAYRNKGFSQTVGTGTASNTVSFETRNSLYNFLGGVQVKDNASEASVKPFAHALIGAGHARTKVSDLNCTNTTTTINCSSFAQSFSDTGVAGAFGGGLDIKFTDKVDIRIIQIDYNPIRLSGSTDHNFRFGAGIKF